MDYYIDLFTGTTWEEFRKAGARVSGFSTRMRAFASRVKPGDVFLCYMTGVQRWVGALRVTGHSTDQSAIWKDAEFPVRFAVESILLLDADCGLPMSELEGKVHFYHEPRDKGKYKGFVRGSPGLFKKHEDGDLILSLLRQLETTPIRRPVDPKQLARRPLLRYKAERRKGKATVPAEVSIPEPEDSAPLLAAAPEAETSATRHTEMEYHLLQLGVDMGFDAWVARNDRNRTWNGHCLADTPHLVDALPTQFNEATTKTVELIDVLWLKGNSIIAAFEVECTSSIYSSLLRMSDLLALQPNLEIKLYLVAPDERESKVEQEVLRPTFALREKPLAKLCGFLSFSRLMEKIDGIRKLALAKSLKPDFLDETATFLGDEDGDS